LKSEEMATISKLMANDSSKDLFHNQIRETVYKIIALFFHLRSYANLIGNPDYHLANIVVINRTLRSSSHP